MTDLEFVPLSDALGVEVRGIDLNAPMSDSTFARIEQAWFDNLALLFRDQELTEETQVRFAQRFGRLGRRASPGALRGSGNPSDYIMLVSNIRENGEPIGSLPDGEMHFHSDMCYVAEPHGATMLYAIEVPRTGGDTRLSNQYKALAALSPETRAALRGKKALHIYQYGTEKVDIRGDLTGLPRYAHPIITRHPGSGRETLFVNRLMTGWIEDMPLDVSDRLLEECFEASERPEFVYAHKWRPGDLLIWDNRCCNHGRTDFSAGERRLLRRCTVAGVSPIAA